MWFGWIPTLAPKLALLSFDASPTAHFPQYIKNIDAWISKIDVDDNQNKGDIVEKWGEGEGLKIGCYRIRKENRWNDVDPSKICVAYAYFDEQRQITHVVFRRKTDQDAEELYSIAKLCHFCDISGIIGFVVKTNNGVSDPHQEEIHANHHFKFIRDLYHQHIWTEGDFEIFPVHVSDPTTAVETILDRYFFQNMFVDYPRFLQNLKRNFSIFSTAKALEDSLLLCHKAAGEALFALTLANHTNAAEEYQLAVQRGADSFCSMAKMLKEKLEMSTNKTMKAIAFNTLVVTALSFFVAIKDVSLYVSVSLSLLFVLAYRKLFKYLRR